MKIQLDKLMTEQQNPDTMSIDRMNSFEIVKAINNEDKKNERCACIADYIT